MSYPPIFDTATIETWRVARKTKPLRAKPMVSLLVDKAVMSKFLIDTLEAREPVDSNTIFCIGETNDAWQQTADKLLAKYTVEDIDADGWMVCVPKPDNSVEFFEATSEGMIVGLWGESIGDTHNLQRFDAGDFIARNREDTADQWVVRRKIWLNSYTEIATGSVVL